ncbi:hypothetical protein PR048_019693 [Dryococelus australis]|uniref:PiggyBac transposable element-derived protein domain-containing protein n=1 Tax=Dryococelus australis TaxID=614101 RepID=A0ABQ9H4A0_9NEOP|nr:hypothetical protein PR048_019693 [Dryococelus australis]
MHQRKRKAVALLSTKYHDATIYEDEVRNSEIIQHYNETKGGVDLGDMITNEYSCVRMTIRWPLHFFMKIIDIAALNTYILWKENNPDWHKNKPRKRRCFLHELMLAKPHIVERAQMPVGFQNNIVSAIEAVGIPVT